MFAMENSQETVVFHTPPVSSISNKLNKRWKTPRSLNGTILFWHLGIYYQHKGICDSILKRILQIYSG